MTPLEYALVVAAVVAAFVVSASAGLGGSLILVPALALVLGTKEGVALAALLLAVNNVVKVFAYRSSIPLRKSIWIVLATIIGTAIGASLLVAVPDDVVTVAVIACFVLALLLERLELNTAKRAAAPGFAVASGLTSGFSGTSGPLKGVAIRTLDLDRQHFVGAASVVSFAGDLTKTAVFTDAQLLGPDSFRVALAALPLMIGATFLGRHLNQRVGERGFTVLFWSVMAGYTARLLSTL